MLGRIFGRRASLYWILQNRLFLLSFSIYSIFLYLAPNSWYIIDIKPFYWSMKPHFHLDLRFSTLHMYYLETNVYHIGLSLRYSSHQSCQQATFFRPGLACCLAWYDLRCLQARPKIKDRPAAWPGLTCRPNQAEWCWWFFKFIILYNSLFTYWVNSIDLFSVICLISFHKITK